MLNKYINKNHIENEKILVKEFLKAKPFPHLIIKDFLKEDLANKLSKELKEEKFTKQESDLFSFSQSNDLEKTNNKTLKEFYNLLNSKEFKEYLEKITNIKAYLKIDCSGFIYTNTDYLLPHDDRLETRKVAYVLNLSKDFIKEDGGSLDFFENNKIIKSITPKFNTFTIFKVIENKTYHQVSEVLRDKERLSIAGWFNN